MPGPPPPRSAPIELAASGVVAVVGRFPTGPSDLAVAVTGAADATQFGVAEAGTDPSSGGGAAPGGAAAVLATVLAGGVPPCVVVRTGAGGGPITGDELIGDAGAGTGLHALDTTGAVGLVCIPDAAELPPAEAAHVYAAAAAWCTDHGAFLLVDAPRGLDDVQDLIAWTRRPGVRSPDAAMYVPRVVVATSAGPREVPTSGAVAAVIARTDRQHGVWEPAAGTDAALLGVDRPATTHRRGDLEALHRAGIGTLRELPGAGLVVWGARTLAGGDHAPDPAHRYIPVRRTVRLVERSLRRGLGWVSDAANEPATWHQVLLAASAFLDDLWRRGALRGDRPERASFVRVGHGLTMTDADLADGTLRVQVGLAVTRPAEFVVTEIVLGTADRPTAPTGSTGSERPGPASRERVVVEGSARAARVRAERAVAAGLGREVVQLDLDALTSAYIGETEHNLELVLDLAEDLDAVLLLDEADALFGRRSEVDDAPDRDADPEVAHVRTRLEDYPGTVILGIRDATRLGHHLELRRHDPPPS